MYSGFVFFCDSPDQEKCLKSKIFACADSEKAAKAKVGVGSIIFLFNEKANTLLGPFTSLAEGAETVDAGAWKEDIDDHTASQNVKLEWEELHLLTNAAERLPFLKELKACALSTTQTQRSLDLLNDASPYAQNE